MEAAYEERLADADGEQRGLGGTEAMAQIERVGDDLRAKAEQFEEREEGLRSRFEAVVEE